MPATLLQQLSNERVSLLEGAFPSVAALALSRRRVISAIRWRSDLLVTEAESITGFEQVHACLADGESSAEVLAADLTTDVAVLRLDSSHPTPNTAQRPANSATPRVGDLIALVGRNPHGPAAAWGAVRFAGGPWQSRRGGEISQRLELDARLDPALIGAAVLDMTGAIIAMAVPGAYHRILGIPAQTIERVVAQVEQHGHLPRPYIGVRLQPLWLDEPARAQLGRSARRVPVVSGVDADSPAAHAQLELGDLLLGLNGKTVDSADGLAAAISRASPGQVITLEVLRAGKPQTIDIQVGERPRA